MTTYSPKFDVTQFELRNDTESFLSSEQRTRVTDTTNRISSQLNWLAQLLGWSGNSYWASFNPTVDQKRQLLTGSFGVYNGFVYPEIIEVRNWDNTVVVKYNPLIVGNRTFILNQTEYYVSSASTEGDNLLLKFEDLPVQFYNEIANNYQLKTVAPSSLPAPFRRPFVGVSCDRKFICNVAEGSITLYPSYDTGKTLPYLFNVFFAGSRYYFDLPVKLIISDDYYIAPTYKFDTENWYIDIPCEIAQKNTSLSARLDYEGSFLIVSIKKWEDPTDWIDLNKIQNFTGVWGNKGGPLPFHFTFDALSLHGFDDKKSLYLDKVERSVSFDSLLNLVYQQTTQINPLPPPITGGNQLWWNSQNGTLAIYNSVATNCGPWVEITYPYSADSGTITDFVFPTVLDFQTYTGDFFDGCVVTIVDCSGLSSSDDIFGLATSLTSTAEATLMWNQKLGLWIPLQFTYPDTAQFEADAISLPAMSKVYVEDSDGLSPTSFNYKVANLGKTISGGYSVLLMKYDLSGDWYLAPPSELKYIGQTRLFESSIDYDNPVDGEMVWDFDNPDPTSRTADIFYYNRWEQNIFTSEWELKGDWVGVNTGLPSTTPPEVVDLGVILVYCDGQLLTDGSTLVTENYQIKYSTNLSSGEFEFLYQPKSYEGTVNFPQITISDSITTSFTADITNIVFSGLTYYMSPNVADGETLLRIKKDYPMYCLSSTVESDSLSYPNALVADGNLGPLSTSWEKFFIRLPPSYQRNGEHWQKVNLVCQDFSYWGSSAIPEDMGCPSKELRPAIYDDLLLMKENPTPETYIYAEPYLYSNVTVEYGSSDEFGSSMLLPTYDDPYDTFSEAELIEYDPLHERRADTYSPMGRGYGEWEGEYYRVTPCAPLTGHLVNDIVSEAVEPIEAPIWDCSMYKIPVSCVLDKQSGNVDANHYKIGYAHFAADLSAAEEAVFEFG